MTAEHGEGVRFSMQRPGDQIVSEAEMRRQNRILLAIVVVFSISQTWRSRDFWATIFFIAFFGLGGWISSVVIRNTYVKKFAELDADEVRFFHGKQIVAIRYESISEIEYVTLSDSQDRYEIRARRPDRFTKGRSMHTIYRDTPYSRELVDALEQLRQADLSERPKIFAALDSKLFTRASLTKTASE